MSIQEQAAALVAAVDPAAVAALIAEFPEAEKVGNHPSGVPEPSRADENLTKVLKDALALVDVRVLDHVIVAGGASVSFAQRGLL